jgi:hypothetical protein
MRYFISYVHYEKKEPFFGNAEWEGDPITSLDQIKSIEKEIRRNIREEDVFVKILYWIPFESY